METTFRPGILMRSSYAHREHQWQLPRYPVPMSSHAMGVLIQPAQPQSPLPHHGGAGAPARGMPPSTSGATHQTPALPPPLSHVAAAAMPPPLSPAHSTVHHPRPYEGVKQDASTGKWTATVFDPDLNDVRLVGAFPDEHTAALAHDRLDIAFHYNRRQRQLQDGVPQCGARVPPPVSGQERVRHLCHRRRRHVRRALRQVSQDTLPAASEIWREADDLSNEKLTERFIEMHQNKATTPRWREWYHRKIAQQHAEQLQGAAVNKRKADDEDDQQHKRRQE
ncbi:hypothetical protein GUJ93_ZPchr0013g35510 [Zizania palustris]|uniref:AP2/ERF domain-containing protein n=1 Tax=Zizania palustris TaxID=103762 RepID=A0A8J5WVG2_ZIZPA|nr:hypothetical protein GUJ93_ZPchr0013g35510 [Zizania palustris]